MVAMSLRKVCLSLSVRPSLALRAALAAGEAEFVISTNWSSSFYVSYSGSSSSSILVVACLSSAAVSRIVQSSRCNFVSQSTPAASPFAQHNATIAALAVPSVRCGRLGITTGLDWMGRDRTGPGGAYTGLAIRQLSSFVRPVD